MTTPATASEQPSRLRYAMPPGWTRSLDGKTLLAPGGGAAITFSASIEFTGTAAEWAAAAWNMVAQQMAVASGPVPAVEGAFRVQIGIFRQADGSSVWLCINSLVNAGRGENVIYFAQDEAVFRTHLPALATLLRGITIEEAASGATPSADSTPPVEASTEPPPLPRLHKDHDAVAGLHFATTRQLRFNPFGSPGSADWQTSTEYYLLSPDGRVFRGRDFPVAPEGDISRFDYEAARREAPGNYGTYTVSGNEVVLTFPEETVAAQRGEGDGLKIRGTQYRRSIPARPPATSG